MKKTHQTDEKLVNNIGCKMSQELSSFWHINQPSYERKKSPSLHLTNYIHSQVKPKSESECDSKIEFHPPTFFFNFKNKPQNNSENPFGKT